MRSKGSKTGKKARAAQAKPAAQGTSSAADLIDKAHTLLAQSNFELAVRFLERALELEPANAEARELVGIAELEGGDPDKGREHLLLLLPPHAPAPPAHPSPYLYLAQTAGDPHEALGYYSTAAAVIERRAAAGEGADEEREMAVSALVAMVEIWMSDLCFDPAASDNCDALVARALALAPGSAEARLALASVRTSQSRFDEARAVAVALHGEMDDPDSPLPALPTRLLLARLLLEHGLHAPALDVVGTVRDEDALEVEGAYLEGWAWWLRAEALEAAAGAGAAGAGADGRIGAAAAGPQGGDGWNGQGGQGGQDGQDPQDEPVTAAECLAEAMRALVECSTLFAAQEHPDAGIGAHAAELLALLRERGVEPAADDEDEGEGEGGDAAGAAGWEDVDDDVEMS